MTPTEKIQELKNQYDASFSFYVADEIPEMEGALVYSIIYAVADELEKHLPSVDSRPPNLQDIDEKTSEFWSEVKKELLKK